MRKTDNGFIARSIRALQKYANPFWKDRYVADMRFSARFEKRDSPTQWPCESSEFKADVIRENFEYDYYIEDEPFLYPGAMLAWEKGGFGANFATPEIVDWIKQNLAEATDDTTTGGATRAQSSKSTNPNKPKKAASSTKTSSKTTSTCPNDNLESFRSAPVDGLLETIWPCVLIDASPFGVENYGTKLDAVLCYPTFDNETSQKLIGVLAFDPNGRFNDVLPAKIVAEGNTFEEIHNATRENHANEMRTMRRRMAGFEKREEVYRTFDVLSVIPELAEFAIDLLCAMTTIGAWEDVKTGSIPIHTYTALPNQSAQAIEKRRRFLDQRLLAIDETVRQDLASTPSREEEFESIRLRINELDEEQALIEAQIKEIEKIAAAEAEKRKAEKAQRIAEQEARAKEKAAARELKAQERARRKAENIAAAERKAKAKAERLAAKERKKAEDAELSAIANTIQVMKAQEDQEALAKTIADGAPLDAEPTSDAESVSQKALVKPESAPEGKTFGLETSSDPETASDPKTSLLPASTTKLAPIEDVETASSQEPVLPDVSAPDTETSSSPSTTTENPDTPASATWTAYEIRRLTEENARLSAQLKASNNRATFVETMQLPTSPTEALEFALDAFPDRLVATPEARDSASTYNGSIPEMWRVLQAMACTLHPLIFGELEGSLAREFQAQCGFELALRDVKQENARANANGSRKTIWKGQERDMTPHVKGKGSKRNQTLRVHFFADYDEQRLVIAHCGEHLASYLTSKI